MLVPANAGMAAQGMVAPWPASPGAGSAWSLDTMTFLAALRHDCVEAPWLIDGPINGEKFRLYT